jgi:hypothetical protein
MLSKRAQDKISSSLSGWYTSEWNTGDIVWSNDRLMVKSEQIADEIAYNLKQDLGREIVLSPSDHGEFNQWTEVVFQ